MSPAQLYESILQKQSLLCVALDPSEVAFSAETPLSPERAEHRLYEVIEKTTPYAVAYKLNTAFYERWGEKGWELLRRVREALPSDCLCIADAKRGDIAHTNRYYAQAFYEELKFDALTVHVYMGWEALSPFLEYRDKWVFGLLRTTEAAPWQTSIWRRVIEEAPLNTAATIGWVWGAHYGPELWELRQIRPNDWLLIPGFGAQGGELAKETPAFPALITVGRTLLQQPEAAAEWAARSACFLPTSEATGRFELP
ncbi:MAG: orotidine-5'-phosphate decarboxylase [Bacteroidia bacterium]|nr:orotidine-5'-phosphate decarboxylase [Bacteroidia bacterium]